ncbi:MAG: hypothetical protein IPG18_17140 [Saprospiraceae bacterium]|nr:hypothetical protein [Saprospiraceae bacterium]
MGNLLSYNTSFNWPDNIIDRNNQISNLHDAVISARDYGDKLYYHPNLYSEESESYLLISCLWSGYDNFKLIFPWIRELEYQSLYNIFLFFRQSPFQSLNLQELLQNTGINNNAWIGIVSNCPEYLVHHNLSWRTFHRLFVSQYTLEQRRQNFEYFNLFFEAELTLPRNQIQQLIDEGHGHDSITRIDPALIPHEQIHIHFDDDENCALNIDGTWKHEVVGYSIQEAACILLTEWGFKLPHEYYQI